MFYLYHGNYGGLDGIYFLSRINRSPHYFEYYTQTNFKYADSGVVVISDSDTLTLSELILDGDYAQYFDIIPTCWLNYIINLIGGYEYVYLCFIPQSDIEQFLNTYWKYEGGN